MPQIITIPTPCHEDWNIMTDKEQGRHCNSCCKTVIDFTNWQPQEILFYFKKNKNICGRFEANQLNEPIATQEDFVKELFFLPISTLKKVAAIFLFAFVIGASSCNENVQGKIIADNNIENITTKDKMQTLGGARLIPIDTTKKTLVPKNKKLKNIPALKGQVAIVNNTLLGEPVAINQPTHLIGDTVIIPIKPIKKPICKPTPKSDENFVMSKMAMPKTDTSSKR